DASRGLEPGDALLDMIDELQLRGGCTRSQFDVRDDRLAPFWIRQADDGRLEDGWVRGQDLLDLDRGDVLAAGEDDVLLAVADLDVPVGLQHPEIARTEPPSAAHRPARCRGAVAAETHV